MAAAGRWGRWCLGDYLIKRRVLVMAVSDDLQHEAAYKGGGCPDRKVVTSPNLAGMETRERAAPVSFASQTLEWQVAVDRCREAEKLPIPTYLQPRYLPTTYLP